MADFVVGASIQTNRYNLVGSGITASTTVPFSGINSYDFTGVTPGNNSVYVPAFGRICWGLNDFTLECFIRGNGTDDPVGNIFYLPVNADGAVPEFGRNIVVELTYNSGSGPRLEIKNTASSSSGNPIATFRANLQSTSTALDPSTFYHLAIVRKNNKISILFDGEVIIQDIDSSGNVVAHAHGFSRTSNFAAMGTLFKPFGGINISYSLHVKEFVLGSITSSPSNLDGFIANFRSSYIAQYDVTQTSYTVPSAAFTGAESGTDFYAKTFSGSGFNNSGTALPSPSAINPSLAVNELVLENSAVGSVTTVEENNVNYPINPGTNLTTAFLGNVSSQIDIQTSVTGLGITSSVGNVGAGLGLLVPVTQLTANISLGDAEIPTTWSEVQTGTTTNWTEVNTG